MNQKSKGLLVAVEKNIVYHCPFPSYVIVLSQYSSYKRSFYTDAVLINGVTQSNQRQFYVACVKITA